MNNLDKVIRMLIATLKEEKDEKQRRRIILIIKELKRQGSSLVDSSYLRCQQ